MNSLSLILMIPSVTAILCFAANRYSALVRGIGLAGAIAQLGTAIYMMQATAKEGILVLHSGGWKAPVGISLVVDKLSALMLLVTGIIAVAVMIYSYRGIPNALIRKRYVSLVHFLLMGVNGAFIAGDLFNLYVWFEVMLISSFVLISFGGTKPQLEGGVKYLVINLVSSILFLSGIGLIYGKLGTLNMADIARALAMREDPVVLISSAMLLVVAFGIKSALFPFFFWLPASYHTPRIAISALFAGLLTKVGVYAFLRSTTLMFYSQFDELQPILLLLAGATMLTGVLGAAAQYDIRKILSFHIVSQIGYILLGVAVGTPFAIAAAIFYTFHHILVKSNLFLITGLIERYCGSSQLRHIGGLYARVPALTVLFFIPAFSLGGIPPLSGFWAKFALIKGTLDAQHYVLVGVALMVGALTLYSMTKIWAEAFWKPAPEGMIEGHRPHWTLWLPCIALAMGTVWIGLCSEPLFAWSLQASEQLSHPDLYIDTILGGGAK